MRLAVALLAFLLGACAAERAEEPAAEEPAAPLYTEPVALFVDPDSVRLERMRVALDSSYFVAADDAMWYRAEAAALLDSVGVPHRVVEHGPMRFRVGGEEREYEWREMESAWYLVLYDGRTEPVATFPVDARDHLARFAR